MSNIIDVNDNNFENEVMNSQLPVLVDFGATWCGPCQRQLPILEKFATDNLGKIKVCKLDIDDSPAVTVKFGIRGVPSLILFNQGSQLEMKVGLASPAVLNNMLSTHIK